METSPASFMHHNGKVLYREFNIGHIPLQTAYNLIIDTRKQQGEGIRKLAKVQGEKMQSVNTVDK